MSHNLENEAAIFEAAVEKNRAAIDAMSEHDREQYVEGLADGVHFTSGKT